MKVLFVSLEHSELGSGGKVITQRNREFVERYFGEENVICVEASSTIKIRQQEIEKTAFLYKVNAVFIDASFIGFFSKSFYRRYHVFTFFHNVETNYCDEFSNKSFKQKLRSFLIRHIEERNCNESYRIITLNERDSAELKKIYGRGADYILHSSMRDEYKGLKYSDGEYLLFIGTDFFGNTDGLFPFIENCMEHIDCNLKVVGNGMEKYASRYDAKYKTDFVGFVDDLASVYANARAVVLPIVSGSGMKTKTCEALMYGKVIFGTDEAFEGYDIADSDCYLCNSDCEFIDKVNNFLKRENYYFSEKNRNLFLEKYDNEKVYKTFKAFMDSCTDSNR